MPPVATWDLLLALGFVSDAQVISNPPGGLSIDFGNFTFAAHAVYQPSFSPCGHLIGVMTTTRTIAEVECEMPEEVESPEQGVAWVTWCLDEQCARAGCLCLYRDVPWLAIGRQYKHLLPWERQRAAYAARLQCSVPADFARVGLRSSGASFLRRRMKTRSSHFHLMEKSC